MRPQQFRRRSPAAKDDGELAKLSAEREHLLRSLDLPGAGLRFGFPVFMMPDGRSLWDYDSIDSAFWPVLPSES